MGCYAKPLVTSCFPSNPVTTSAMNLREHFFNIRCFLPGAPSCCFQDFSGFNLKVSRTSCWNSKHSSGLTICLNHSNPQKIYMGRFYLRARAGQSQNINLYGNNTSLKMFASYRIWTLVTVGEHVTSLMFYPFGHKDLQTMINSS